MEFTEWEPAYEAILADMGYDREADVRAREELGARVSGFDLDRLDITGRTVAVVGAGPSLSEELESIQPTDVVFAASEAADTLEDAGVTVDLQVTDLDGSPAESCQRSRAGTPVAVHAHGDNSQLIRQWVERFDADQLLPTTQAEPTDTLLNAGGFTDGDRAAFLADHLGAASVHFPGWLLDDPSATSEKRAKLRWAERLLRWLELRREESFELLDGRRASLSIPPFAAKEPE